MKASKNFRIVPAPSSPRAASAHLEQDDMYPVYQLENGVETYLGMFSRRTRIEEYLDMTSQPQREGSAGVDAPPAENTGGGSADEQKNWEQFADIAQSGDTERLSQMLLCMSEDQVRGLLRLGADRLESTLRTLGDGPEEAIRLW